MIMDVLVGLILVGAMVHGLRKGFIHTFIHTIGWVLALVMAYIATPFVKRLLMGETTLYDSMKDALRSDSVSPCPQPNRPLIAYRQTLEIPSAAQSPS